MTNVDCDNNNNNNNNNIIIIIIIILYSCSLRSTIQYRPTSHVQQCKRIL